MKPFSIILGTILGVALATWVMFLIDFREIPVFIKGFAFLFFSFGSSVFIIGVVAILATMIRYCLDPFTAIHKAMDEVGPPVSVATLFGGVGLLGLLVYGIGHIF
jgi:hypothetical protein